MTNLYRGLYGLVLLVAALTFISFLDLLFPQAPTGKDISLLATIPRVREGKPQKEEMSTFAAIQPACFLGYVKAPPGRRARPGKKRAPRPKLFTLRGTMLHSDPMRSCAFIDLPGKEGQQVFFPGDKVQGAELTLVAADHVLMQKGSQTIKLEVSMADEAPRGSRAKGNPKKAATNGQPLKIEDLLRQYPQMKPFWKKAPEKQKAKILKALKLPPDKRNKAIRSILRKQRQGM